MLTKSMIRGAQSQCSLAVEHPLSKREVVGSNPAIGLVSTFFEFWFEVFGVLWASRGGFDGEQLASSWEILVLKIVSEQKTLCPSG